MNYIKRKYSENKLVGVVILVLSLLVLGVLISNYISEVHASPPNAFPVVGESIGKLNPTPDQRVIVLNECGNLDVSGAIYMLKKDIFSQGTCFNVMADNVVIQGNSYSIVGDGDTEDYGIYSEGHSNLKINGLKIESFGIGVYLSSGVTDVTMNKIVVSGATNMSIYVFDADEIVLKNSEFTGNLGSETTMFLADEESGGNPIHLTIFGNNFHQNEGSAIRGIGTVVDIHDNIIIDNGEATQSAINRGIWVRSIIELPAPGRAKVPAGGVIYNNKLVRIGGSGIVCSAYDQNVCEIYDNFLKDVYGPASISFGFTGSVAHDNLIMNSENIGIDVIKRYVRDISVIDNVVVNSKIGISSEPGLFSSSDQSVENVTIEGNRIIGSYLYGIFITGTRHHSSGHIIRNNIVSETVGDAFYIKGRDNLLSDITFEGNEVSGTADDFYDFHFEGIGSLPGKGFIFKDNLFGKYFFEVPGLSETGFSNGNLGQVEFIDVLQGSGISLSDEVIVQQNLASINSDENQGFNIPAEITLYNMPGNFENPAIYRDGEFCDECVALTDLNEETVIFEVPGAGSYWIGSL